MKSGKIDFSLEAKLCFLYKVSHYDIFLWIFKLCVMSGITCICKKDIKNTIFKETMGSVDFSDGSAISLSIY